MQNNWLKYIDELYVLNNEYGNNTFIYYPNSYIELNVVGNISMVFRKESWKTKLLFEDVYKRKIYFSDEDIINILIKSPDDIFEIFVEMSIKVIYSGFGDGKIEFLLEERDFNVPFPKLTEAQKKLLCEKNFKYKADIEITYYDLTILIYMIVHKEFLSAEKETYSYVLQKRQLKKFIILSLYYKKGEYKEALEKARYKTNISLESVYKGRRMREHDKLFDKINLLIPVGMC